MHIRKMFCCSVLSSKSVHKDGCLYLSKGQLWESLYELLCGVTEGNYPEMKGLLRQDGISSRLMRSSSVCLLGSCWRM